MAERMSIDSLKANLTNPQRVYLWEVMFPNLLGGGDAEALSVRAQSASIPGRSVGSSILIPYKQTAGVKFAGKLNYSHQWTVTFIEGEDRKIFDAVYAWSQLLVNDITGIGVGDENNKANIYFNCLNTKDGENLKIKLIGCYVESVGDVSMSYDAEGTVSYQVTFSFDSWEPQS